MAAMDDDIRSLLAVRFGAPPPVRKIAGEASLRRFYRFSAAGESWVAMVYPQDSPQELDRIAAFTALYREHGLRVPDLRERLGDRVLLLEDAGDLLLQGEWRRATVQRREYLLDQVAETLVRLASIPAAATQSRLDGERMHFEMDFFIRHFVPWWGRVVDEFRLRDELRELTARVPQPQVFAHRDFHSRNMLIHRGEICLVDFQDSLQAPAHYDLVSLAFDSYLDLEHRRDYLLGRLEAAGWEVGREELLLTALERNIKALGTFAYQIVQRRNLGYKKYVARTLRHIRRNLGELACSREFLQRYFAP